MLYSFRFSKMESSRVTGKMKASGQSRCSRYWTLYRATSALGQRCARQKACSVHVTVAIPFNLHDMSHAPILVVLQFACARNSLTQPDMVTTQH